MSNNKKPNTPNNTNTSKPQFGSVIENSVKILKNKFKYLFIPAFILCAITQLISNYMSSLILLDSTNHINIKNPVIMSLLVFIIIIIHCLIRAILMVIAYDSSSNKPEIPKVLSYVIKLLPYLILNFLIYGALTSIGLFLYIIPGILVMTCFALYEPIIIFEQRTNIKCLIESFTRVKSIFFTTFLIVIFCIICEQIPAYLFQYIGRNLGSSALFGLDQAIEIFINAITLSFVITTYISFYDEVKNQNKNKNKNKPKNIDKTNQKKNSAENSQ